MQPENFLKAAGRSIAVQCKGVGCLRQAGTSRQPVAPHEAARGLLLVGLADHSVAEPSAQLEELSPVLQQCRERQPICAMHHMNPFRLPRRIQLDSEMAQ